MVSLAFRDVLMIGVLIFFFGTGFFILNYMMNTTIDSMLDVEAINETQATVDSLEGGRGILSRLDGIVMTLFFGLILALIITGYFVGGHPIFMAVYIIALAVTVPISVIMSNFWETLTGQAVFGSTITSFGITNHLIS